MTHGSMASQTAEACFDTLMSELRYITDYFKHIGYEELSTKVMLKCLTTKLVECFSSHMTKSKAIIFASLRWQNTLQMTFFSFLLLDVNTKHSGVSIRSEKYRNVETYSYSQDTLEIDHTQLLWSFLHSKHRNLFSVEKSRVLRRLNRDQRIRKKHSDLAIGENSLLN